MYLKQMCADQLLITSIAFIILSTFLFFDVYKQFCINLIKVVIHLEHINEGKKGRIAFKLPFITKLNFFVVIVLLVMIIIGA